MSSRGWKLSQTIVAISIATGASAETLSERRAAAEDASRTAGFIALGCSVMAATVYAELSDEDAETVARMSIRKCRNEWDAAKEASCKANKLELIESGFDRKLVEDTPCPVDDDVSTSNLRDDVIDWRVEAKVFGSKVYEDKRLYYKGRLKTLGVVD